MFKRIADFVKTFAKKIWNWSMVFHWIRFWEKVVSFRKLARKENGTISRRICYLNLQKVDIPSSVQRHHCPEENWKVKGKGKCPYTSVLIQIQLIHFIALSVNQLSIYGAVAALCDEYEGQPDNTVTRHTGGSINCSQRSQSWSTCSWRTWRLQYPFAEIFSTSQNNFHQKTDGVNSVRKQDSWVL